MAIGLDADLRAWFLSGRMYSWGYERRKIVSSGVAPVWVEGRGTLGVVGGFGGNHI